jgi:ribosomal protein S12 methylthiotransferase accessory factor
VTAARVLEQLTEEAAILRRQGAAEENSDRLRPAADTVAHMRPMFGRFGITRIARVTDLDRTGIPVWMATRPNSRTLAVSQGKGITDAAAQASAIMEAAELATAEAPSIEVRVCSAQTLLNDGEPVLTMRDLLARGSNPPFASEVLEWVQGLELFSAQPVWVPAEAVLLTGYNNGAEHQGRYWQSSDGLASGNLLFEAVVHAICERIERDACVLWRFRSDQHVAGRCIDIADLDSDAISGLAALIRKADLELRLFDVTSDLGVPTCFATISPGFAGREEHCTHFEFSSGSGAHPNPARAAMRAVTEAAQTRVTSISGARDDFDPALYQARLKPDLQRYLDARPQSARMKPAAAPSLNSGDSLAFLLNRLANAGVNTVVVVPLNHEESGFAVAKVLVPGLEHPPGDRRFQFGGRALNAMAGLH